MKLEAKISGHNITVESERYTSQFSGKTELKLITTIDSSEGYGFIEIPDSEQQLKEALKEQARTSLLEIYGLEEFEGITPADTHYEFIDKNVIKLADFKK